MDTKPQLSIKNLTKHYHENGTPTFVLKGISLDIQKGETLAILGPSGAGKSTLLHLVGALDHPTDGKIFFEEADLFSKTANDLAFYRNQVIGFVFQFHHLLTDFSILENVMMPLLIRGEKNKNAKQGALKWLEKIGLTGRQNSRPHELSGGEQQRVALARALVGNPKIVLADEPTGNLDVKNGEKIFDLLLTLNRELNTTLVVVTHNEQLAKKLDRIVVMSDGQIQ